MFGLSVWELLIILFIVMVLFGSKRLATLGTDLGSAIKGFRGAISEDPMPAAATPDSVATDAALATPEMEVKQSGV